MRIALLLLSACAPIDGAVPTYTYDREACADRVDTRNAYFGDLHVHGAFSFDAANYGSAATPGDVFAFAKGASLGLSPLDEAGAPTRTVQLDRPLDFAAATEHGDFLGEVVHCTTPGSPGYDAELCEAYQGGDPDAAFDFGLMLASEEPTRDEDLCGADGTGCAEAAAERWAAIVAAAEAADDRTSACTFAAFAGYEYTNTAGVSNLHRNAIFRNANVPTVPVTTFEATTPSQLWEDLAAGCLDAGSGCDALLIPHNPNLSNGWMFFPDTSGSESEQAERATLRARLEPLVEIFQHKGDSECRNGYGDPDDPDCAFEKIRPEGDEVCPDDAPGAGGMRNWGCTHRLDYVRNVLKEGLSEERRLGVNPYRLGFVASTDTHNGTAGLVTSVDFPGHVGVVDDTPEERLGDGNATHDAFIDNPGGLAGVWAVERSRDAIFEAMRRGETFATSGPRIEVRLFGGFDLPTDLCTRDDALEVAYRQGAPMGGTVPAPGLLSGPLRLYLQARADIGVPASPGVGLERIQVVKGWLDASGVAHERVFEVAKGDTPGTLDDTCAAGGGEDAMCLVWEDPDFDAAAPAFWYARVIEVPTCRWSTWECLDYPAEERPERCDSGEVPSAVQQRAWSSPVWYTPG